MTNTELIQAIKAEIDKRYAEYREKMKSDDFTYYEGMADALDLFEQFLDTLESEKPAPKDLEEAAEKFAVFYDQGTCDGIAQDCFIAGAKWQADHTPLPEDTVLFQKGVEEGKRLMMEEAVEGYVVKDITGSLSVTASGINLDGFKFGDKVRIIILPKEDDR